MSICQTCKHWDRIPDAIARDFGQPDAVNEAYGMCQHPNLQIDGKSRQTSLAGALLYINASAGDVTGRLCTAKNFGCVHHELCPSNF